MSLNFKLDDEDGRLAALRRYDVLDTAPEEPFDRLTELVRTVLGVPVAAVSLIDEHRQWFKSIAGLSVCETSREISFCSHAIKKREALIVPDATLDVRFSDNPLVTGEPRVRSYLGIPLETPDGYNVGALCAIDYKPRDFSANDVSILTNFAKLVLNELELRQIAMSDGLTGAMTRRAWMAAAEKEFARSQRYNSRASIILLDLDHFKRVNDTYGHPAGDVVLRTVVQRCFGEMRETDMLGRIGGEEFAILLPATNAAGAGELAERIRQELAHLPIIVGDNALRVTGSFGICDFNDKFKGVDAWMAAADALLYLAKASGRNRCCGEIHPVGSMN